MIKGSHHSPETRAKLSAANKGKPMTEAARAKISSANRGEKHHMWGKHHTPEARARMSKNHADVSGENNPMYGKRGDQASMYGMHHTDETRAKLAEFHTGLRHTPEACAKISRSKTGKKHTLEARRKIGEANSGDKCIFWKGGISFEPYCPKFTLDLRRRVRAFFENRCVMCGKPEKDNGELLSVHHVEYNKQACCDGKPVHFAALCHACHTRTTVSNDRERWEHMLHRVINELYNSRSYFTKDEMKRMTKTRSK